MAGAVTGQRLGEPAQHQVAVGLQHHVDEVDDHDAADVAQPQLAHDLLGRLEVVLGDRLFEVAPGAGELAGVDVDHGHRLGPVDHQRAARGQPHLAVHRLGQLLVDPMHREHIRSARPVRPGGRLILFELRNQIGRNGIHVFVDGVPGLVTGDHQTGEVFVEQVADDLDQHVGLFIERHRRTGRLLLDLDRLGLDLLPALLQAGDVAADVVFFDTLGRCPDDDPGVGRHHLAQDLFEPLAFGVGQLAADPGRRRTRHVDQEPARQRHLRGETGALVPDRVLADLDDDVVAGFERLFDLAVGSAQSGGFPVDLAGVEHAVAPAADVDEGRLHRGQHVLHDSEIDVAHQRGRRRRGHEVLDDDAVFEHRDLGIPRALVWRLAADPVADDHDPFDGLAAGQEFGLGQDRGPAPAGISSVPAPLPLGLQPGRAVDALDLVARAAGVAAALAVAGRALVHHRVGRVVGRRRLVVVVARSGFPAPAPAAAAIATIWRTVVAAVGVVGVVVVGILAVGVVGIGRVGLGALLAPARGLFALTVVVLAVGSALFAAAAPASPATTAAPTPVRRPVGLLLVVVVVAVAVGIIGVGALIGGGRVVAVEQLRRDEERHVMRPLGGAVGGLQHQPGLGLIGVGAFAAGGVLSAFLRLRGQQVTHPNRVVAVHGGVRAARPPIQRAERLQHPLAGGSQRSGQRMNP